MKIIKAYQIPTGSVNATIFNLPCISAVHKSMTGETIYHFSPDKGICVYAKATDWLLSSSDDSWYMMHDDKYKLWKRSEGIEP